MSSLTITLSWWWIPLTLVVAAFVVPGIWPGFKLRGDYDLFTPLFAAAVFLFFIGAAIAVCIGYWIAQ